MEFYPETCNQCGGNDTAYRQFFIKPDENCPMEYKSSAPPTKLMLTPKKACKEEVFFTVQKLINYSKYNMYHTSAVNCKLATAPEYYP